MKSFIATNRSATCCRATWSIIFSATGCTDGASVFAKELQQNHLLLVCRRPAARRVTLFRVNSHEKALAVAQAALEKKAYDLVVLGVEHLNSIADYFLIATGRSDVQVQSIARGIEERMDHEGEHALSIEGTSHAHWVVLDFDDVVVHVFFEETREFYRLERVWIDATEVPLPEPYRTQARDLRLRAMG